MGTILIDKLLSACVKQGASDLHITVGQPPVLRLHGRMQKLKTKVLEPADTVALDEEHHAGPLPAGVSGNGQLPTSASPSATRAGSACRSSSSAATSRWCCGRFPSRC